VGTNSNEPTILTLSIILFSLLLLILIVGCRSSVDPEEQLAYMFADSLDCTPPCWGEINPGKFNEDEFLSIVNAGPKRMYRDFRRIPLQPTGVQYMWVDSDSKVSTKVEFGRKDENIVDFVSFSIHENLDMATIFQELGPPDSFTAHANPAEQSFFSLLAFYEDEGVILEIFLLPYSIPSSAPQPECKAEIDSGTPVKRVILTEPGSAELMMKQASYLIIHHGKPLPWAGFGEVDLTRCWN
jgi:hypothetical protein